MEYFNKIISFFIMYNCSYYLFNKSLNLTKKKDCKVYKIVFSFFLLSLLHVILQPFLKKLLSLILTNIIFIIIIFFDNKHHNIKFKKIILNGISFYLVCYFIRYIALLIFSIPIYNIYNRTTPLFIDFRITDLMTIYFVYKFSNSKKFKKKINIIKDTPEQDNLLLIIIFFLLISITIYLFWMFHNEKKLFFDLFDLYLFLLIIFLSIFFFTYLRKQISDRYKDIAQNRTIDNLNNIIKEKDKEISRLTDIAKLAHKTNHELDILKNKINKLNSKDMKKELNNIENSFRKGIDKKNSSSLLQETKVKTIDDTLRYFQDKCKTKDINFTIKINGSVNYMTDNLIDVNKLNTILSDHLKNAIISIENTEEKFKSILLVIGELENNYGIKFYDTGINFKPTTLLSLGTKPITTHKNKGGTGLGMLTTFQVAKECKASIEIEENVKKDYEYNKIISIIFDDLNEFRIKSYRNDKLKLKNKNKKIKFIKK